MSILDRSDPKIERLRKVPFFANAPKKALEHLAGVADELDIPPGRVLIEQGGRHREAFVIQSGTASIEIAGEVVAETGEGEMVGELSMFLSGAASATVRAKTDMSVLVIPFNGVDAILEENPTMLRAIAENLAARLRAADARQN